MKTLKLLALIPITIFFFACSNDDDNEPNPNSNKRLVKTERIYNGDANAKITCNLSYNNDILNTFQIYGEGEIVDVSLTYNSNTKITKQSTSYGEYIYSYNSQGNVEKIKDDSNKSELILTYDSEGNIAQSTAKEFDDTGTETHNQTKDFFYENGLLKSISYQNSSGKYFKDIFEYDSNDNIIAVTNKSDSNDGISFGFSTRYQISYDDKINPSYKILKEANTLNTGGLSVYNIASGSNGYLNPVCYSYLGGSFSITFYSKNNILSNDFIPNNQSYDYNYDTANYPTRLIDSRAIIGTNPIRKYTLQYDYFYEEY